MSMKQQIIEIEGKKYRIVLEEVEELLKGFRREKDQYYWIMSGNGAPFKYQETFSQGDDVAFEIGNYFYSKEDAEYVAKREILFRKMLRFSLMNGLRDLDKNYYRYFFVINQNGDVGYMNEPHYIRKSNVVYFASEEVARQALSLFGKEFKELYGNN
nr:MAG TPA: hypothetical protein [Caudoviricetes sp.]